MLMISKNMRQVFGNVPKTVKGRMARLRKQNPMWSESKMIWYALEKYLDEIEQIPGPVHVGPHRETTV